MRLTRVSLAAAVLALTGCTDEEPTHEGSHEPTPGTSQGDEPSATANGEAPAACTTDAVATFPEAGEIPLRDGAAVALGGPAYTVYAGDFEVDTDGIAISGARAEAGQHLATVAVTVFNAEGELPELEIGAPIEYTEEFGGLTFVVMLDDEGTTTGSNLGATGSVTVTGLDDESICLDVDYRDEEISIVGAIAARII